MRLEVQPPQRILGEVLVDPTDDLVAHVRSEERETRAPEAVIEIDRDNIVPLGQELRIHSAEDSLEAVGDEIEALLSELKAAEEVPLPPEDAADAATAHPDREPERLRADGPGVGHRLSFAKQRAPGRDPSASDTSLPGGPPSRSLRKLLRRDAQGPMAVDVHAIRPAVVQPQ